MSLFIYSRQIRWVRRHDTTLLGSTTSIFDLRLVGTPCEILVGCEQLVEDKWLTTDVLGLVSTDLSGSHTPPEFLTLASSRDLLRPGRKAPHHCKLRCLTSLSVSLSSRRGAVPVSRPGSDSGRPPRPSTPTSDTLVDHRPGKEVYTQSVGMVVSVDRLLLFIFEGPDRTHQSNRRDNTPGPLDEKTKRWVTVDVSHPRELGILGI